MTAQTHDRLVERIEKPVNRRFGLKAGVVVYQGALIVLTGGYARPGISALNLVSVGIASAPAVGGAADGDTKVDVERVCTKFKNAPGADAVLFSHVGQDCYVLDDQTVTITAANRSVAGKVWMLADDGGVFVEFR